MKIILDKNYIQTSILIAESPGKLEYWRGYLTALLHLEEDDTEEGYSIVKVKIEYK